MLELKNVSVSTEDKKILSNVNLKFNSGVHFIVGPNGAGKSTLAHAIMKNPNYDVSGTIKLKDKVIDDMSTAERANEGLFLSFQNPVPIDGISNFRLLKEALSLQSTKRVMDTLGAFRGLAKELGLPDEWDKKELNVQASGGEKKKNEMIQMIMLDPDVAILDEPDSGLDVDAINDLITQLKKFAAKDKTVIIVSHYEKLLKSFTADTVTVVSNGTAKQTTSTEVIDKVIAHGFRELDEF